MRMVSEGAFSVMNNIMLFTKIINHQTEPKKKSIKRAVSLVIADSS